MSVGNRVDGETHARVLLVEDDDIDAELIRGSIVFSAEYSLDLHRVKCLEDCLTRLSREHFDAVLLDLDQPDCPEGTEALREVHEQDRFVPIVVLVGMANLEAGLRSLRAGAQDYLIKDQADGERVLRVVLAAIQRGRHERGQRELHRALIEFDTAREIQLSLLPLKPPVVAGYDLAGQCIPAHRVGGDYFDFFPALGDLQGIVCGDASGHGVATVMVVTHIRAVLRTLSTVFNRLDTIVARMNALVSADAPSHMFATLNVVLLDPGNGEIQYVCAGHNAFLFDRSGHVREVLKSSIPPINVFDDLTEIQPLKTTIQPGEILLLFTNGITGCGLSAPFGERRLLNCLKEFKDENAATIVRNIVQSARDFAEGEPAEDDMTVVVLKRNE